jgi:hypothetical protein
MALERIKIAELANLSAEKKKNSRSQKGFFFFSFKLDAVPPHTSPLPKAKKLVRKKSAKYQAGSGSGCGAGFEIGLDNFRNLGREVGEGHKIFFL